MRKGWVAVVAKGGGRAPYCFGCCSRAAQNWRESDVADLYAAERGDNTQVGAHALRNTVHNHKVPATSA